MSLLSNQQTSSEVNERVGLKCRCRQKTSEYLPAAERGGDSCLIDLPLFLSFHTVSWWIRKLSCIEEVPRFFFLIQFKIKFKNLNWLQLNLN